VGAGFFLAVGILRSVLGSVDSVGAVRVLGNSASLFQIMRNTGPNEDLQGSKVNSTKQVAELFDNLMNNLVDR
jgi:hypothetical protein